MYQEWITELQKQESSDESEKLKFKPRTFSC